MEATARIPSPRRASWVVDMVADLKKRPGIPRIARTFPDHRAVSSYRARFKELGAHAVARTNDDGAVDLWVVWES